MAVKAQTTFSLADQLFNAETVDRLASALQGAWHTFDAHKFKKRSLAAFPKLELKQRINCMVDQLEVQLPAEFDAGVDILERALPAPLDPELTDDDFGHFIWSIPAEWVARHGVREDRLARAYAFLQQATMRFSVENAIRPFLAQYPEQTMQFVRACAVDDNYHVRRLASEGIRPYLPWAQRVRLPAESVVEVLTMLHGDHTRYVTRSVANTLNDLSRDTPELVINTLQGWQKASKQKPEELEWMTRHALRTLVRNDHKGALEILGYPSKPRFTLSAVSCDQTVAVGDGLHWQAKLHSKDNQNLRIGLRVYFLKANGSHSTKVFALKDISLGKETLELEKKISFKARTTRTLYFGTHYIELVVNGVARDKRAFNVIDG